jgi:SAM-dependent methyltransferase
MNNLFDEKHIFFTICSWNYLAYAITLRESIIKTNGNIIFYAAICDKETGFDHLSLPFPVIPLEELGIPSLEEMVHRYNITELNTAIKPFVFRYLFEKNPDSVVIYMDPDILVTSRLEELHSLIAEGADCVLTPHILEPNEFATFDDRQMLLYGICNLGFCALRATPAVQRVVAWWGRRLERHCVIDLQNGLFVDQKWADLLPAFIEKTRLLHHCGYNVAYWNLSQRRVWQTDNSWTVNNRPLRFFHFSGNRIAETAVFSRHSRDFALPMGDAETLFETYVRQVEANGHQYYLSIPYEYSWNGQSGTNLHTPQTEQASLRAITGLEFSPGNGSVVPHVPIMRVRSFDEYSNWKSFMSEVIQKRQKCETDSMAEGESEYALPGFCVVCGRPSKFMVTYQYSARKMPNGRRIPNWREHLNCIHCNFTNRIRAFLHIWAQEGRPAKDDAIYISEQATRTYSWLAQRFPNLVGSEYIDENLKPGEIVGGIRHVNGSTIDSVRHEDLQKLSFESERFKYILSLDVLEHVPDYHKAIREVNRCLQKGGLFLFSVPFCIDQYQNEVMATVTEDGSIVHLRTPEYHGNPVDPEKGSLCFRYFAWEFIDDLRKAGFETSECWLYWSNRHLYWGEPQILIAARK